MRFLTPGLALFGLLATDALAQSTSTNPLDKPAERTGSRRYYPRPQPAEPPFGSTGGREVEATSAKVGSETWVARAQTSARDPSEQNQVWVRFYRVEKLASLSPSGLGPKVADAVPRPQKPWQMQRRETRNLAQLLYKFVEWSDVADKNRVQVVDKEIGPLNSPSQTLWFHREKEAGPSKSWLIVNENYGGQRYRLSATDVAALLELLDKLPALDDQLLNRAAPKPPNLQPSNPATEELFK